MRREPEFFDDAELTLVYMARRLRDALKLEGLFTDAGIEYAVETGTYTGGIIMRRDLTGAFFYVQEEAVEKAREVLVQNRYKPYVPE
ncbi:MAG: hypothetical protein M3Y57_10700 [Acidobacteriota bacterium]|jgi:hypothetical protein|nr:hypothetical protein [Acidobacteriota bacterium]